MEPLPAPHDLSTLPWCDGHEIPALVDGGCVNRALLQAFVLAMQGQGLTVQMQRMRYDRIYARQALNLAHGLGDGDLRSLAVQLFEHFQRASAL